MRLSDCHPSRKHQARGMCKACYDQWLKSQNTGYKERQVSNTTAWARANPEKMKIIKDRRRLKEQGDPVVAERIRNSTLLRKYGITVDDYAQMLARQGGGCAICNRKPGDKNLHVDHCHNTGVVRGLLCHQCNWYLGTIDSDPELLKRLTKYVKTKGCSKRPSAEEGRREAAARADLPHRPRRGSEGHGLRGR